MQTPKLVYFIRHGQSEGNAAAVIQADDSPLSAKGQQQAVAVAARLSKLHFECLIASPLTRAAQTAKIIATATGKPVEYSKLFVERGRPKSINGKPYSDKTAMSLFNDWEMSLQTPGMRVQDGENYDDIIIRAASALEFLQDRPEAAIVVVTHGYFLRTLMASVSYGTSLDAKSLSHFQGHVTTVNASLSCMRYSGGYPEGNAWRLESINDSSHVSSI